MKRLKLNAAIFSMLMVCSAAAHAQISDVKAPRKSASKIGKDDTQAERMAEAMERLKDTMSKGGSESVAGAGDGVFTTLADFSRGAGDDAMAVRSAPMSKMPRKSGLIKAAADDCWEVCVSWGPLHVCYTWEKRCR